MCQFRYSYGRKILIGPFKFIKTCCVVSLLLPIKQWPEAQFWSCEKFSHINLNDQLLVGYIHSKKGYGEPKSRRKCFLILYQLCHESQSHDVFQLKRYFFKSIKSQFVINQGQISSSFVSCSTHVSNTNLDANLAQKRY